MKLTNQEEQLVEIINDFFGCDASYYGVHPLDLAKHLIANKVSLPHRDCYNCELETNIETGQLTNVVLCRDCPANGRCSIQIDLDMGETGYCSKGGGSIK